MSVYQYGFWEVSIEKHGRIKLPTALLKSLPESERKRFWVAHGFGNHIMLWTESAYLEQIRFLNSINRNDIQAKRYRNAFLRNITQVECDSQDRIVIPKPFMENYKIEKEVVLLLDNGRIELWNQANYHAQYTISPDEMELLNAQIHSDNLREENQN